MSAIVASGMDIPHPSGQRSSAAVQARTLLTWRWLVLTVGVLATAVFELAEGHRFDDVGFAIEFLSYGLIVPVLSWLLLTILAQNLTRRARSEDRFERYRQFTQQLAQRQDWDELTGFVTQFAGTFLSVVRASLYTYDHHETRLEFASEWRSNGLITISHPPSPELCATCPVLRLPRDPGLVQCQRSPDAYCMLLAYNNVRIGALILQGRPAQTFDKDRTDFIAAISPEVALAMALLIAYPRAVARAQATAQLDERRRITYELHDSLAQQIGYLHLALDRVAGDDAIAQSPRLRSELEQLRVVAGDAYERIRSVLSLLRSQQIADLPQAIADYADLVSRRSHLEIGIAAQGEPPQVSPEWYQCVFNLLREGLNNVEKHARALHAHVELAWSADSLRLSLTDDGVGFDPASTPADRRYGLAMMSERAAQLHGDLKIESAPGNTRLLLTIPYPRPPSTNGRAISPTRDRL